MKAGFRILPHTSEIVLEVTAPDWASFFCAAAEGLLALYAPSTRGLGVKKMTRALKAPTPEDLLVAWLSELMFLIATKRWIPTAIAVGPAGPRSLRAQLRGDQVPEGRLRLAREIKAATYHGLSVARTRNGLRARVILDV